jgi:hypothetical protein
VPVFEQVGEPDQPARTRFSHPKGWEPGITFDPTTQVPVEITSPPVPKVDGDDWSSVLDSMDFRLPDGYSLRLIAASYDPYAWTRQNVGDKATTAPAWRYKFAVTEASDVPVDGVAVLDRIKRSSKPRVKFDGEASFVTNLNDWQLAKEAGGGIEATIERLDAYFDMTLERAKDLGRHNLGELIVLGGGDIVEGCAIYPNQSFQIQGDRRTQSNLGTTLIVDYLDRLAPHFGRVRVLAVGGNHGEHRINGKRINRHDNDDCKVFEDAARELSRDQTLQHVTFAVAQEQPALTIDVQGHILALTHGHVYGKGKGGEPTLKAYNWYKNMAAAHHPVGDATVLVGNHFHHDLVKNWGTLLFVQNPAADGGSPEFADYSGTDCAPGLSTWVMDESSRFRDYEVIR